VAGFRGVSPGRQETTVAFRRLKSTFCNWIPSHGKNRGGGEFHMVLARTIALVLGGSHGWFTLKKQSRTAATNGDEHHSLHFHISFFCLLHTQPTAQPTITITIHTAHKSQGPCIPVTNVRNYMNGVVPEKNSPSCYLETNVNVRSL